MLILTFVLKLENPRTPIRAGLAAVDWLGVVTIVAGTLMFLLGLEFGGVTYPWKSPTVICLILFGLLTSGLFVVIEWKFAKYPIIPMRLFKTRSNVASLGVSACHGFVFISASYYLPLYFQAVLGASPLLSGVYVLPFSISLALTSTATGIYIRKTGKYKPCIIFGMTVMTLGFGLFINLGAKANWAKIVLFQLVAGIVSHLPTNLSYSYTNTIQGVGPNFQSPLISLQTTVPTRDIASATATFGFIRQLATSISVVIGGVVFQNCMQKQYPSLLAQLGPDTANLLTGGNAGASVGLVAKIPGHAGEVAREAYWSSLKTMYILYVAFAGLGMAISFMVTSRTLSKQHEEAKTGLKAMEDARAERKLERAASDEEKAARKLDRKTAAGEKAGTEDK